MSHEWERLSGRMVAAMSYLLQSSSLIIGHLESRDHDDPRLFRIGWSLLSNPPKCHIWYQVLCEQIYVKDLSSAQALQPIPFAYC